MYKHSGIFNTCNRSPKWKNLNEPIKTNIRNSIIFNEKRDFRQSVENYSVEELKWSQMNSCCILDNSVNGQNMDVVFLDENDCCSCLALRLLIQEQLLMKTTFSLLVFIKKLEGGTLKLKNSFIYIKCAASLKWPLFYDLFEFLVKELGRSVIGSQFYIHFICKDLIHREKWFLQKIKENHDHANFIQSISENQMKDSEISSKRQLGIKTGLECNPKANDSFVRAYKRKLVANFKLRFPEKYKLLKSKNWFSNKVFCICKKNKWQCFKPPMKDVALNYTNILNDKSIRNEFEITQTSMGASIYSSTIPKVNKMNLIPDSLVNTTVTSSNKTTEIPLKIKPYHKVSKAVTNIDINLIESRNAPNNASVKFVDKESINKKNIDILQHSLDALGKNQSLHSEIISANVDQEKCSMKPGKTNSPKMLSDKTKCYQKDSSFIMFQTASGKAVKISEESLQIAKKMYSEVCSQMNDATKNEENRSFSNLQEEVQGFNYKHHPGFSNASKSNLNQTNFGDNKDTLFDDRFFEEISLDEKEINGKSDNQSGQPSSLLSSISCKSQSGKVKKSLGGRRSLKPYVKKQS